MGLIVCDICDRQRELSPMKRGNYRCSNCGAENPEKLNETSRNKLKNNWKENDGIIKIEAMRRTYAGLKWLQKNKHFNPKYPQAKFMGIFGNWPPDIIADVPPYAPTSGLIRWIERSNQRWKKQKAAEEKQRQPEIEVTIRLPEGQGDATPSFMTADDWNVKL